MPMSPATVREMFMASIPKSEIFARIGHFSSGVTVRDTMAKPAHTHSATTENSYGEYYRASADIAILFANAIMYVVRYALLFHLSCRFKPALPFERDLHHKALHLTGSTEQVQ